MLRITLSANGSLYCCSDGVRGRGAAVKDLSHNASFHSRERIAPSNHGIKHGIIFINRNGLRWRDAPEVYGPHKTLYSRWKRWSEKGIFAKMMAGLAAGHGEQMTVMIDATYLKAHRTATSMAAKKGDVVA